MILDGASPHRVAADRRLPPQRCFSAIRRDQRSTSPRALKLRRVLYVDALAYHRSKYLTSLVARRSSLVARQSCVALDIEPIMLPIVGTANVIRAHIDGFTRLRSRQLGSRCSYLSVPERFAFRWSGQRDSNSRPSAWEADTLPLSYARKCMASLAFLKAAVKP